MGSSKRPFSQKKRFPIGDFVRSEKGQTASRVLDKVEGTISFLKKKTQKNATNGKELIKL